MRSVLLAGLMTLAMGAGALAQSPSPEATVALEELGPSGPGQFRASGSLDEPRSGHTATRLEFACATADPDR